MKVTITFAAVLLMAFSGSAQQELKVPTLSPITEISQEVGLSQVKLTYSRPSAKGRKVFGGLVPFNEVWRTGANEATEITTTKNIQINGTLLKAGTYSLFTIPQKEKWTIIINSELGLWGAYNYNSKLDVMRFDVPVTTTDTIYESFTMQSDHRNEVADLLLYWDKTKISIPIKFIN